MRLISMTAMACVLLGVAAGGLAACGDAKPVDPTAGDADLVDAPACTAADLSLAFVGKADDKTQVTYTYAYVNKGAKPCTLRGYPDVEFVAATGTAVEPISVKHADASPRRDPIRPGKRLIFDVVSAKGQGTCVSNARIKASAPVDGAKPVKGDEPLALCDNVIVWPVRREVAPH